MSTKKRAIRSCDAMRRLRWKRRGEASESRAWSCLLYETGPRAQRFASLANGAAQPEALAASFASTT
jgi:hypothetical protein